ncbi:MAG: sigma-54-dependent Fis family transcriptional regulator, partial [Desulfobacteraceae bacterium]|nr:sigma-54-dependent Fis family transcriptional regulator [Desulfobacteraceae bacterium]
MKTLGREQGNDEKPVFIVDDEPEILVAVDTTLRMAGLDNIITISDSRDVIGLMERRMPRLVLLDLNMPHINGVSLLKIIRKTWPEIPVIVLTGAIEVDTAVQCMKIGAVDYLVKPVEEGHLLAVVDQTLGCENFVEADKKGFTCDMVFQLNNPEAFRQIITQDKKMYSIFQYVESIAPSSQPVLIFGETGVGKELICQVI